MPEGPEAAIVADALSLTIVGTVLAGWRVLPGGDPCFRRVDLELASRTIGDAVTSVASRGKAVIVRYAASPSWVLRLGMSGTCSATKHVGEPLETTVSNHTRVIHLFRDVFGNTVVLSFNDPRKFGGWKTVKRKDEPRFGVDWRSECSDLVLAWKRAFEGKRVPLKPALLDQRYVAGIGNVYACEALHAARLAPTAVVGSLSERELFELASAARKVMDAGYRAGGLSIRDFVSPDGSSGEAQKRLNVYGKTSCGTCGGAVTRETMRGRVTYWCQICQSSG